MSIINNKKFMSNYIFGEAKDGTKFDATSEEVQKRLAMFPEDTLEHAIGVVVDLHNKKGTLAAYTRHIITEDDLNDVPKLKELGFLPGNYLMVHKNRSLAEEAEIYVK